VTEIWMQAQAYQQFTLAQVTDIVEGRPPGARSSLNKLYWSELDIRLHETALELLGSDGQTDNPWSRGFQFSLAGPIYAGTNEIQRNIVAERVLGLPRK
jgi:alkylation response protein AidB-like acyl-CoA dehydrogenase